MPIISLAGSPGSGKSTIGRIIAQKLGIPFFSMGDVKRQFAMEHGISILELSRREEEDPTTDRLVDEEQASLPQKHPSFVIDSRLGFHFLPQSLKVYVKVDPRVGAQRILDAKRSSENWHTVEEGMISNKEREDSERLRYGMLYSIDHKELSHYDLILDSTHATPEELAEKILQELPTKTI
jgi:predicted cytidylate kinase